MTPGLRKFALTSHVTSSVGWLGAVGAFLALAIAGVTSQNAQTVRAAYLAMHMTTWFVIVPLCLAALLTGIVQSLGTTWGLFRHYWIVTKLVLTRTDFREHSSLLSRTYDVVVWRRKGLTCTPLGERRA
jgi:hypothetical protein